MMQMVNRTSKYLYNNECKILTYYKLLLYLHMLSVVVTNSNGSVHAPDIDNDTLEQLVIVGASVCNL